ncbi:hypothetical protein ACTMU2_30730 [Cupriavidus basilensis]
MTTQSATSHYFVESPSTRALVIGAIGVCLRGTSVPARCTRSRRCFSQEHGIPFSPDAVLGIISMLFW